MLGPPYSARMFPSSKAASVQTRRHRGGSGGLRRARRPHRKPLEGRQPHGKSRMIMNEFRISFKANDRLRGRFKRRMTEQLF